MRGEYLVRDFLRDATNLQFERVPQSGALEYLKGDIYVPNEKNNYCIEVKFYKESPLSDKVFTQERTNDLARWWKKICEQAKIQDQLPLLFFKYNRSKIFVCTYERPKSDVRYIYINWLNCFVMMAHEWIENEEVNFIGGM